ncbi:MAG: ATP-binding protein [Melioribacteraceae bacterium]|nr:ATP-binding protein [Melioribacteraceae bacterium]
MLQRYYQIDKLLQKKKVLVIYGARRVGKTTLLKSFLENTTLKYKLDSGENIRVQRIFSSQDFQLINSYVEGLELLAIDEAQQIPNIGMGLKILVDQNPELLIIATGSSSFDLSQQIGEPLTGRKRTRILFPFAQSEIIFVNTKFEMSEKIEETLIFGNYPEVLTSRTKKSKIEIINEIVDSYLLKDILQFEKIRGSQKLFDLLKLLAFQIGNEVSIHELSKSLRIDSKTVSRYIDILENSFVIKKLGAFSRNLRDEITKKNKYFFWDNGIRNGIIKQFNELENRNDIGALFENFVITERLKRNHYNQDYSASYFWRTFQGGEIDYIEDKDGKLTGHEIKWSPKSKFKIPNKWKIYYPGSPVHLINSKNYLDFVL